MAKLPDVSGICTAPVFVLSTRPEWEEPLRRWAETEAALRHGDLQMLGAAGSRPVWEIVSSEPRITSGGLIVVGPMDADSVTELLIDRFGRPGQSAVAVVPAGLQGSSRRSEFRSITVGFHGTASSKAALRWAESEAVAREASVRAVMAWSESPYCVADGAIRVDPHWHHLPGAAAARIAESTVVTAGLAGDRVKPVARRGTPALVLVDDASESDLLVVGAGRSRVHGRPICGVTTLGCLSRSPVPLVIVPTATRDYRP